MYIYCPYIAHMLPIYSKCVHKDHKDDSSNKLSILYKLNKYTVRTACNSSSDLDTRHVGIIFMP